MTVTEQAPAVWDGKFYDSASYQFPESATRVMEYADGDFTPAKQGKPPMRDLYPYVHDITSLGGTAAWPAQFLDYEQFLRTYNQPGQDRDWCEARLNRSLRTVPYCDRANLHRLRGALGPLIWKHSLLQFWIPTGDGRQWTASALSLDIASNWGVFIPPSRIWGNQFAWPSSGSGGPWDTSNAFGSWD